MRQSTFSGLLGALSSELFELFLLISLTLFRSEANAVESLVDPTWNLDRRSVDCQRAHSCIDVPVSGQL